MDQVIITAALTGAVTPKAKNAHIPITPEEIAADAYACWKAGAAMVHLHMRADDGLGAMDKEKFRETIRLIRSHQDCDVIINCTSSGASAEHPATDEERMAHHQELEGIEMGSYDAGTFNWMPGGVFMNSPQFLEKLGDLYLERGIKPEVEIFDAGMLGIADYFAKQGHLSTPATISFAWAYWAVCLPRWKIWYIWCAICRRTPPGRPLVWGRATCPSCMRPWPWADISGWGSRTMYTSARECPPPMSNWWNGPFKRCAPSESSPLPPLRPEKSWA